MNDALDAAAAAEPTTRGHQLRPGHVAAAAAVIGGALIVIAPQHALSIVRLVVVTAAAAAGLYALAITAPPRWWLSPFDESAGGPAQRRGTDETDWIRAILSARRQRIRNGPPLPPGALRLLQPLIAAALEREAIDPHSADGQVAADALLSPPTRALLRAKPLDRPGWFQLVRPDPRRTAQAVQTVLDELDRLTAARAASPATPE